MSDGIMTYEFWDFEDGLHYSIHVLIQSYPQGHWIEDSKKIGSEMQKKALGFS